jgi:thiol-disulfide isomerase/thioredoxin
MSNVHHPNTDLEYNNLKNIEDNIILIDFAASWCGPCKRIAPVFESLSVEFENIVFVHVDIDDFKELDDVQTVKSMPTFRFYKNNELLHEITSSDPDNLRKSLEYFTNLDRKN